MAGRPVGKAVAEINLDATKYEQGLKRLHDSLVTGTIKVEDAYKSLGIKSDRTYATMRANAEAAVNFIKNKTLSSLEEIARAEKAKNDKIKALNAEQFGHQTSTIDKLKANWIAASVAIGAAMMVAREGMEYMRKGAKALQIESSFKIMADSAGVNSEHMIASMKKATRETIDDSDMMQKAVKLMTLAYSPEQIERFSKVVVTASQIAGTSSAEAYDQLADAIANRMPKALVRMGAVTREQMKIVTAAVEAGADSVALYELAMANLELKQKMLQGTQDAATIAMQRYDAQIKEMKETIGKGLIVALAYAYSGFQYLAGGILGVVSAYARYRALVYDVIGDEKKAAENRLVADTAWMARNSLVDDAAKIFDKSSQAEGKASKQEISDAQKVVDALMAKMNAYKNKGAVDALTAAQASFKASIDAMNPELSKQESLIDELIAKGELLKAKWGEKEGVRSDTSWVDKEVERGKAFLNAGFPKRLGLQLQFEIDKIGMSELESHLADINYQADEYRKKEGARPEIQKWQDAMTGLARFNDELKRTIVINDNLYDEEKKRLGLEQELAAINIETSAKGLAERVQAEKEINQYRLQYAEISPVDAINRETEASKALIAIERDRLMDQVALRSINANTEDEQRAAYAQNVKDLAEIGLGEKRVLDIETQRLYRLKELTGTFAEGMDLGFKKFSVDQGSNYQQGVVYAADIAAGAKDTMKSIFFDGMRGEWKNASDYADMFLQHLENALANLAAKKLMQAIITGNDGGTDWLSKGLGFVGSLLGMGGGGTPSGAFTSMGQAQGTFTGEAMGGYYHSGGSAGHASTYGYFPASLFASAPRLHKGLAADEYPAILQRGETVTPRGGSRSSSLTINAPVTVAPEYAHLAPRIQRAVERAVQEEIRKAS